MKQGHSITKYAIFVALKKFIQKIMNYFLKELTNIIIFELKIERNY